MMKSGQNRSAGTVTGTRRKFRIRMIVPDSVSSNVEQIQVQQAESRRRFAKSGNPWETTSEAGGEAKVH